MRIITPKRLRDFTITHATAEAAVTDWIKKAERARWKCFADVRRTFNSADQMTLPSLKSGVDEKGQIRKKAVVIFNVGGNNYRVIASINYKTGIIYILFVLTHAEYSQENWKKQL